MSQAHRRLRGEMKEVLSLLDSTHFTLKGRGFDAWTKETRTRNTQGIKLHVLYEATPEIPVCFSFTPANVNDRDEAVKLEIEPEAIDAFDKAYCDYGGWHHINRAGARFVTRFKNNAALKSLEARRVPEADGEFILKDETVLFSNPHPRGGRKNPYRAPLRRVTVARPDHDTPLVLATNDLESPALQIARHYKARWGNNT